MWGKWGAEKKIKGAHLRRTYVYIGIVDVLYNQYYIYITLITDNTCQG